MQHYGIHYLTIEGDKNEGLKHLGRAQVVIDRLQQRLELGGLQSGADWERLSDDAYLYARVAMGVNAVRIVVPSSRSDLLKFIPEDVGPPDWLSGVVTPGVIEEGPGLSAVRSYWPTLASQNKYKLSAGLQRNARLAVKPDQSITAVQDTEFRTFSQHAGVKPTMYSGLMRRVVQLLLGYGKASAGIYQDRTWTVDTGQQPVVEIPPSQYEQKVKADGYQILYDYRPYRTHGVIKGQDNAVWLIEISATRGIVAMPLPLHKDSITEEFALEMQKRSDTEAQQVLELLGGFPTGESFPAGKTFDALERAGQIVRLADSSALDKPTKRTFYGSAMGWSINDAGTEAHNTCYDYNDNGYQFGEHWKIGINIGSLVKMDPPKRAEDVRWHVANQDEGDIYIINLAKVDRLTDEQAEQLLGMRGSEAYAALDAMRVPAVATGSASVGLAGSGDLYYPSIKAPVQYKVWEPMFEGGAILSHDMRALEDHVGDPPALCDTVVLAFFVGNDLKTGKFFNDRRTKDADDDDGTEECMYVGSWTSVDRSGTISITPGFYMADLDERQEIPESETTTVVTSEDLGYSAVKYSDHLDDIRIADFWREKRFRKKVETNLSKSISLSSALIAPGFARDACYMATMVTTKQGQHSITWRYEYLRDPNWAQTWRAIISTAGWDVDVIPQCGNRDKRRVRNIFYGATGCSDFADSGQWFKACDIAESMAYNLPEPPLPATVIENPDPERKFKIKMISAYGDIQTIQSQGESWFAPSPDPDTDIIQYMWATGNCLGDIECQVYSSAPNDKLIVGGKNLFPELASSGNVPCFIGVV